MCKNTVLSTNPPLLLVTSKIEKKMSDQGDVCKSTKRHISRDHSEAAKVVCIVCFRKARRGEKFRNLTDGKLDKDGNYNDGSKDHMREFVLKDFEATHWEWLPVVICDVCRKKLARWKKQKVTGQRWLTTYLN